MVQLGIINGEGEVIRLSTILASITSIALMSFSLASATEPQAQAFRVYAQPAAPGPRITPLLQYQIQQAWREDEERQRAWEKVSDEAGLLTMQRELRQKLLAIIGGLPAEKTELHP